MSRPKPLRVCDECRYDGGIHYTVPEDGGEIIATRCPNFRAAELQEQARQMTVEANERAMAEAKEILEDVARHVAEFDANYVRDLFDERGVPTPIRGAVFSWARSEKATADGPLIVAVGDVPPGEMPPSTRHRTYRWQSRIYGQRRTA